MKRNKKWATNKLFSRKKHIGTPPKSTTSKQRKCRCYSKSAMLVDGQQRSLTKNSGSGSTTQYHHHHISTPTKHRISTALLEPYDNVIVHNEDKENIIMMVLEDNDAMASSEATFNQQLKFDKYYRYRGTNADYERNDLASCTVYPSAKRDATTTFCPLCDILINEQLCYYDRLKRFHKCHLNALTSNGWNVNRTMTKTVSSSVQQHQRFRGIPINKASSVCRPEHLNNSQYDRKINEPDAKRTLMKRREEENGSATATSKRKYRMTSNKTERSTVPGIMSAANSNTSSNSSILHSELLPVSDVTNKQQTIIEQINWTKDSRKKLVLKFSSGRHNILYDVLSQKELLFLNDILNQLKDSEHQRNFRLIQTRPAAGTLKCRKEYPSNYFVMLLQRFGITMEPAEEELQIKRKRTASSARQNRTVRLRTLLLGLFFGFYLQNNADDAIKNRTTVACVTGDEKSFRLNAREATVTRLMREFLNEYFALSSNGDSQIGINREDDDGVKIREIEDMADGVERTIHYSSASIDRPMDDFRGSERVVKDEDVLWSQFADNMNRTVADFDETIDTLEMLIEKLCRVQTFDKANGDTDGEQTSDCEATDYGLSGDDSSEPPQPGTVFYEYSLWNSSIFENSTVDDKNYSHENVNDNDKNRINANRAIASQDICFEPYRMWSSPYIGSDILQSARQTNNNSENRNGSGRTDDTEDDYNLSGKYDLWTCPDLSKCLWNNNNSDENIVASTADAASFPISFKTVADLTASEKATEITGISNAGELQFHVSLKNLTAGDASTSRFSYFSDQSSSEPCNSMGSSMYSLFGESIDYATTNNVSSPHYDPHIDINRKLNPLMRTFAYEEAALAGACRFNLSSSGCSSYNNNSSWPDNDSRNGTAPEDDLRYRIVDGYSLPLLSDLSSSERNNGSVADDGYHLFRNNRLRSSNAASYNNPSSASSSLLNEYSLFPPADESNGNRKNLGPENLYSYLQSIKSRSDYRMEELRLDQEVEDNLAFIVKSGRFDERYLFKPIDPPTNVPLDDPPVFIRSASGSLYNEQGDKLMEFNHPNAGPDDVLFRPKFRILKQDKATQTNADLSSPSSLSSSSAILSSIYRNILDLATLDGLRDIVDFSSSPATTPLPLPPASSESYGFNECSTILDFQQQSHRRQQQRQQIDCNFNNTDNVNSNNVVAV